MFPVILTAVFSLALIGLVVLVCRTPAKAEESCPMIDIPRMIRAIKETEDWDGRSVGAHGELGPMQFKAATWGQFSRKPFFGRWGGRVGRSANAGGWRRSMSNG